MVKAILCDFARVLLFPKDISYVGRLDEHDGAFALNTELLQYFQKLKGKISLSLFSSGRNYEAPEIKKKLDPIFDHYFNTSNLGLGKTDPQVYAIIAEKLNKKPEEIVFIDDVLAHVEAANKTGLKGIHYRNNEELILKLRKFL